MQPAILIVEDDAELARALSRFFRAHRHVETAGTLAEARALLMQPREWSAVILDLMLPDGLGLDLLEEIRGKQMQMPVLVLTGELDRSFVNRAQALRAEYVCKPPSHENLTFFIKTALSKDRVTEVALDERIESLRQKIPLSNREAEVLRLACQGLARKDIATQLGIAESTAKSQIRAILRKTSSRTIATFVQQVIRGEVAVLRNRDATPQQPENAA